MRGIDEGLRGCPTCHLMVWVESDKKGNLQARCPRCRTWLYPRIPYSLQHTWALVIASAIFYLPANFLPIMHVHALGSTESDTIMSGVLYFIASESYGIALVIFVASVFVPLLKISILVYLLLSIYKGSTERRRERVRLYRLTEFIGRWSMIDIFVVAIMIALVQFQGLAQVEAGAGAVFFILVVVLTMIAAMRFDPRFLWDTKETHV